VTICKRVAKGTLRNSPDMLQAGICSSAANFRARAPHLDGGSCPQRKSQVKEAGALETGSTSIIQGWRSTPHLRTKFNHTAAEIGLSTPAKEGGARICNETLPVKIGSPARRPSNNRLRRPKPGSKLHN
jgi:hypothetical protein